jgi:ABC-type antimicrobial peptide transport system permease subunit
MGAQTRDVLKLVIGQGAKLIGIGLSAGLLVAVAGSRLIAGLLYQVSAFDALIYLPVLLALGAVALLACWIPARRATRVDPMIALRSE